MLINNIKLVIVLILLLLIQFIVNNFTIFYVDLFGIFAIILLLYGSSNFSYIVGISVLADLFGYWYIGEHLIAIVALSILSSRVTRVFSICNWFQKLVILEVFTGLLILIIYALNLVFNKHIDNTLSFLIQLIVVLPILQIVYQKIVLTKKSDVIWYE